MQSIALPAGLAPLDVAALALLLLGWAGMGWWIEHPTARRPSVSALMAGYRREWMAVLVQREHRIFDAAILQNLREGTAFFASTCLIALGGVLALAGNPAPLQQAAAQLPGGAAAPDVLVWQGKLLLVALILTSGFLRFVWSNRLFGYFSVLIGAIPLQKDDPAAAHRAAQAADLNIRAAVNFNRGLRAIYFALAALAWLLGPAALMLATLATVWMLWHREFLSRPRRLLAERAPPDTGS